MEIITIRKKIFTVLFYLILLGSAPAALAQCPTITDSTQSFCDIQSPTVANLSATNNGGGISWYATATSVNALSASSGLTNGEDYFVDNAAGNCGVRQSVVVTIYGAPTGLSFQGDCYAAPEDATVANLTATGNNIQWYTTSSGGTPLAPTTVLVDNAIYYASQTNPDTGCETSRLAVFVGNGIVPVPVGPALQQFCTSSGTPTVNNLVASGNNNWYLTASSAAPLNVNTPLVDGQSYFATTLDPPCESDERLEVVVDLVQPSNAGTSGTLSLCENVSATSSPVNLFTYLGGTPQTTGAWTGPFSTTNGHLGTLNIASLTAAGSPYVFTYTVSSAVCQSATSTVTITIRPAPEVSYSGNTTICSGGSAAVTFTGTENSTVTYNINGGANQTIVLNNAGIAILSASYTSTATINLISISSPNPGSCTVAVSGSIVITVVPLPVASIASNTTVCSGQSATVTFTGTPNATVRFTVNGGPNQQIVLNASGTATITNSYTANTTYTLVNVTTGGAPTCSRTLTGSITITVVAPPVAALNADQLICSGASANVVFTGTPNATVAYTVNGGANQTITLNASGTATISNTYAANTTFQLVSVTSSAPTSCTVPATDSLQITIRPVPTAAITTTSTAVCQGGTATVTFTGTPNSVITYTVNGGSNL
ncbi:MAG TPA: hypothetical protein VF581_01705, partial [Flavobacterium sp.]